MINATRSALSGEIEVELDVFSGRPNPRWTVAGPRAAEVSRRLPDAPVDAKPIEPPGLGYRGFLLGRGLREIRVFGGVVAFGLDGTSKAWVDSLRLESYLADLATEFGYGTLVKDVVRGN
jgi:hypothetical protein